MEKFLWNLVGVLLVVACSVCLIMSLVTGFAAWCVSCLLIACALALYGEKRPAWIEV